VGSGEPRKYPDYVSNSPSPTGVKAFYTYLEKEMDSVKRWSQPPNLLPTGDENQLLVMVEPSITPNSDEIAEYINFMEAGNTILFFKENPRGIFDLSITFNDEPISPQTIIDLDGHSYQSELESKVFFTAEDQDEIVLESENGRVIALKRTYGNGNLLIANTPGWLTNENILNEDHLQIISRLFNEVDVKSVFFNEYIHGIQDASLVNVYPKWFLLLLLQGAFLICLLLWYQGKRFGFIVIPREETVRFSDERLKALAAWYIRGRRYQDSIHIQADYVKLLLQERWGIPYSKDWMAIETNLEKKLTQISSLEIRSFVIGLSKLLKEKKISKKEYLFWSKKLNQLRKEVEDNE
jgi:membrane protein DedA with SNARE-associated domain